MEFTITTNHRVGLQVKKCFESKVLKLSEDKGLNLVEIEVFSGCVNITVECGTSCKLQSIFFLGVYSAGVSCAPLKFDSYSLLPFEKARKLLTVAKAKA